MVLKETDFTCFVANFEDKATNLRRIAQSLNVGLDSFVFLDDSPVERAWISRELPEVLVIDVDEDPASYCTALDAAKAFSVHRVTSEDTARNASYQTRQTLAQEMVTAADLDAFLASLAAEARI